MKLQEYYFRKALRESDDIIYSDKTTNVKINHETGQCMYKNENDSIEIVRGPTFPKSMYQKILQWRQEQQQQQLERTTDYYFRGLINDKKKWVHDFSSNTSSKITHSMRGRNPNLKYQLDETYYRDMCDSKFILAPNDVYSWSYRFFEAIMCGCIPILHCNDKDIYALANGFHFYTHDDIDSHEWRQDWIIDNDAILEKYHIL